MPNRSITTACLLLAACTAAPQEDAAVRADASRATDAPEPLDASPDVAALFDGGGDVMDAASVDAPALADECAAPPSSWIVCDGFEAPSFDAWDDYDGNPPSTNQRLEHPGPRGAAGNHVGRLRVPPGRGGADLVRVLPVSARRIYARWYVQWEPGYDFAALNHGSGLHAGAREWLGHSDVRPLGDDWATAWLEPVMVDGTPRLNAYAYYPGMYMDCVDPTGACWGDHFPCMAGDAYCTRPEHGPRVLPVGLETGHWYCVEEMLDVGAPTPGSSDASGALSFWIDGTEIGPFDELWMRSDEAIDVSILWLSLFHHGDHSEEGILFDDVVASTERIGCR
jgi:hypothetical protein